MALGKPHGTGRREEISLDTAASHLIEECRMVIPGIQALFGFQLIAVFNDGFDHKLAPSVGIAFEFSKASGSDKGIYLEFGIAPTIYALDLAFTGVSS